MSTTPLNNLNPSLVAEVEAMQLNARRLVQGALAGMHRSPRRGSSIEFSEHKLYTPGDEIRHIDWRAFAKTDRFHVKQFEDETNITMELLVDHSASMGFRSGQATSKLDYGRQLASALSYLALKQGDATGLLTFHDEVSSSLPARARSTHLLEILAQLTQLEPSGKTGLSTALDRFAQMRRRRSVAVLISDLFDPDPDLFDAFSRLAARRHDVAVLHVLDRAEVEFPYEAPAIFESMEDDRQLFVHPRVMRQAFVEEMQRWLTRTARRMAEAGIDYHQIVTDTPPARALGSFLKARTARAAGR